MRAWQQIGAAQAQEIVAKINATPTHIPNREFCSGGPVAYPASFGLVIQYSDETHLVNGSTAGCREITVNREVRQWIAPDILDMYRN